jgi:hypothetical protein
VQKSTFPAFYVRCKTASARQISPPQLERASPDGADTHGGDQQLQQQQRQKMMEQARERTEVYGRLGERSLGDGVS